MIIFYYISLCLIVFPYIYMILGIIELQSFTIEAQKLLNYRTFGAPIL